jgi:hypothetical protein
MVVRTEFNKELLQGVPMNTSNNVFMLVSYEDVVDRGVKWLKKDITS